MQAQLQPARVCARAVLVFAAALLALALYTASASAIMVKLPHGGYANYDAIAGKKAPQAARIFDTQFTNLDYSGGPVMPSNTNYTIVWQPSNYSGHTAFQTGYTAGVNTFFHDMAADSGKHTNSDSVSAQYNDVNGNVAAYQSSNGGLYTDTDPLPANGCPITSAGDICITDAQIQAELDSFLAGKRLPHDMTHEYYLLTPPDVASCFDSTGSQGCSANADTNQAYCAYHSSSVAGYIYANIPDLTGFDGCDPFASNWFDCPNYSCDYNNGPADGVLSAISHEHNESITDPQPNNAWTDWGNNNIGGEIGDKCNNDGMDDPNLQFGGPNGASPYNEVVNGDDYLLQTEWSNQGNGCMDSFTPNGTVAHASFTTSPGSGNTVNFNAGASTATGGVKYYVWQFNDGPGQTTTAETTSPTTSHTFAGPGPEYVALTVMANDGTSNGTAQNVSVGGGGTPSAAFTVSPGTAVEGTTFSFDGSGSTDPGGTIGSYAWNFGDGQTGSGVKPTHAYTHYGTYTASLTVSDSGNHKQSTITHTVTVTDESPTAAFSVNPSSPTPGSPAQFDGTGSHDPDGTITGYSWNFGDGSSGTGATPSHTYATNGAYTVTLKVTDSDSQTATTQQVISVGAAPTPTAAFGISPGTAVEGTTFAFDGSGSTDPGGTIGSYAWNFGDGQTTSGIKPTHAYTHYGTYTVSLTVTDSTDAKQSTITHTVTVSDERPTAAFSPVSATAGSPALFIGSASSDPDGSITGYSWNFGDGSSGTGATPSHTYSTAGVYTVTLTVTDSDGQQASVQHAIAVAAPPAPIAAFSFSPGAPDTSTAVSFTGVASSQPGGGSITAYLWNFGDGASGNGASVSHTYSNAGTYTVSLTVVGTSGRTATVAHQVTISPGSHGPRSACTVPRLKGKTLSQARGALSAGHCSLGKVSKPRHAPKHSAGHGKKWELVVSGQSPAAGHSLAKGSRVAVTLAYKAVKTH